MPHFIESQVTVEPIQHSNSASIGAVIHNADLTNLSDEDFSIIEDAFYTHNVILFKNQQSLPPIAQYELTKRFDPSVSAYGHDKKLVTAQSVIARDISNIPSCPQVQVLGNGTVDFEGTTFNLKHPSHQTFHQTSVANEREETRFYRWHIDAALYGRHPPRCTSLMAVQVPECPRQTLLYDDDSHDTIDVQRGSTAFVSSEDMFDMLSEEDKHFARTTRVQYAPHPYIWMSTAKSRSDGLGMVSEGKELPESELPEIDESKICVLPMCWKNRKTGRLALQVHPSAVQKLILEDGTVIGDLKEVREIVHRLQRPGIAPSKVWCVEWEAGDMVLFNNHAVLHSVTGSFRPDEIRIYRQCNLASSEAPLAPA